MTFLIWQCPKCGQEHDEKQDPVYGPFGTVMCDRCGRQFDFKDAKVRYEVNGVLEPSVN